MSNPALSVQLWSLRHETSIDPIATLKSVPKLGFDGIELAGTYNLTVEQWKAVLGETGLRIVGAHIGLGELEQKQAAVFEFQAGIGNRRLIVPSLPGEMQNPAGYKEAAMRLNRLGVAANDAGFIFGYHNHAFEFAELEGGGCGMDILLAETDPSLVRFEFDVFWLERGGKSAVPFLEANASRVFLVHAKELDVASQSEVVLGKGSIDFPSVVALAKKHKWPIVVEFEGADAPAAVQAGALYLQTLL